MTYVGRRLLPLGILAAVTLSTSEPVAVALVKRTTMSNTARMAAPSSAERLPCAADAAQLAQCLRACASGGQTLHNFCSSLPDPRMRSVCYGLELGSEVACQGFCYLHWGT